MLQLKSIKKINFAIVTCFSKKILSIIAIILCYSYILKQHKIKKIIFQNIIKVLHFDGKKVEIRLILIIIILNNK